MVFFDEAEALLRTRDAPGEHVGMIHQTMVPQFLSEMDGFDEPACLILLATNRPGSIDPAVTRDGRIDRKVFVGRPSIQDAASIFGIHLRGIPMQENAGDLAREAASILFDPACLVKDFGGGRRVELRHLVAGSMIAQIVDRASTRAIRRDLTSGSEPASGVRREDLRWAIESVRREQNHTNLDGVITEIMEAEQAKIALLAQPGFVGTRPSEPGVESAKLADKSVTIDREKTPKRTKAKKAKKE